MADAIDDALDDEYWEQLEQYYNEDDEAYLYDINYNEIDKWCLEESYDEGQDCYMAELVKKKSE